MTDLELSFQFPIKRDGASPVVAPPVASVAAAVASGVACAEIDGSTAGAASSFPLPEFEITIAPSATTPTSTNKRTLLEDPCLGAADGFDVAFAATGRDDEVGVVETLTRDPPVVGTGGITTFEDVDFLAADFLTAFLVVFFAADFLTTFFAVVFLAAVFFFAAVFFTGDFFAAFLAVDFFAVDFFGAAFLAALFFFTATVCLLELCNGGIWEKFNLGF